MYARDDYKRCVCAEWADGEASCPQATAEEIAAEEANNSGNDVVVDCNCNDNSNDNSNANTVVVDTALLTAINATLELIQDKRDEVDASVDDLTDLRATVDASINDLVTKRDAVEVAEGTLEGLLS